MRSLLLAGAALFLVLAAAPVATAAPQGCPAKTYTDGGVSVATHSDCSVTITEQAYDCFWGGHWTTTKAGPVTVRTYSCDPEYPPQ